MSEAAEARPLFRDGPLLCAPHGAGPAGRSTGQSGTNVFGANG